MEQLKIGKRVKLIKVSKVYMTYKSAFTKLGFKNTTQNPKLASDLKLLKNTTFTVFSIGSDKLSDFIGIENESGTQILIKNTGIKVINNEIDFSKINTL